jgi:hypothetical protein
MNQLLFEMLIPFSLVCCVANSMEQLLQLSLTAEEEHHLVDFLKNCDSPFMRDLLVLLLSAAVKDYGCYSAEFISQTVIGKD